MVKYLHTMVRVLDLDKSKKFYELLGLVETRRIDSEKGRFSLIFMIGEKIYFLFHHFYRASNCCYKRIEDVAFEIEKSTSCYRNQSFVYWSF